MAVVADFHGQCQHEDDAASDYCRWKSDEPIGDSHVGIGVAQRRNDDSPDYADEQADGETDERADKSDKHNSHWNGIPARWARRRHASRLHHFATVDAIPDLIEKNQYTSAKISRINNLRAFDPVLIQLKY